MNALKNFWEDHDVAIVVWVIVACALGLIAVFVFSMNQFEISCHAQGGHVHSTFLYYQTVVVSTGKTTTTSLIPVYDYTCVK